MQILTSTVILCTPLFAQAAGIKDYSSHKPPSIKLPAAGGSYIDPVFGTKVIRVTDSSYGAQCTHAYSYWSAFNYGNSRLLVKCDANVMLFKFDPITDKLTPDGILRGTDGPKVQFEGASWSYSSPDIIFAADLQGARLWKIDVSRRGAQGYTLLKDLSAQIPSTAYISQLTVDGDGHVFSFHTRDKTTGAHLRAMAWDRTTNKTYVFPARSGYTIDESIVDRGGTHVYIAYTNWTAALWDFRTGTTTWLNGELANDNIGGHFDLGQDFMVNSDMYAAGMADRTWGVLRPPEHVVKYLRPDGTYNWSLCDHVSMRTRYEEFFIGSTYCGDKTYAAFENEIYLGYLDGHGFVRLAHTRSAGNVSYWSQPRATVDYKGRYVVFTSDLGTSRTDVLIVKIPSEYWP